jgi:hypothetical protein
MKGEGMVLSQVTLLVLGIEEDKSSTTSGGQNQIALPLFWPLVLP